MTVEFPFRVHFELNEASRGDDEPRETPEKHQNRIIKAIICGAHQQIHVKNCFQLFMRWQ